MNSQLLNFGDDYRLINVSSGAGAKTLKELVDTALAAKSGAAAAFPAGNVLVVSIKGSADLAISDVHTGDETTLTSGTWRTFPCAKALEKIRVKNSATVAVEIIFQTNPAK